jgi:hypothetical protein
MSLRKLACYLSDSPKLIARDEHVRALQQLEQALNIATNRAEQAKTHWNQSRDRVAQLEAEQIKFCQDIKSCTHDTDTEDAIARAADIEYAWTRSREGADQLQALLMLSVISIQSDKITALEEASNLQLLLKESESSLAIRMSYTQRRLVRDNPTEQHRTTLNCLVCEHSCPSKSPCLADYVRT